MEQLSGVSPPPLKWPPVAPRPPAKGIAQLETAAGVVPLRASERESGGGEWFLLLDRRAEARAAGVVTVRKENRNWQESQNWSPSGKPQLCFYGRRQAGQNQSPSSLGRRLTPLTCWRKRGGDTKSYPGRPRTASGQMIIISFVLLSSSIISPP